MKDGAGEHIQVTSPTVQIFLLITARLTAALGLLSSVSISKIRADWAVGGLVLVAFLFFQICR